MTTILTTDRLRLRTFEPEDAALVTEFVGDWDVCSKLSRVPFPYTREMADQWIASHDASPDIICAIEIDGAVAGCIAQELEYGYWLAKPFWGKGIMTEASRAFVTYLFAEEGMHDLGASFFKDNPASGVVLERSGFTVTGESKAFSLARDAEVERYDVTTNRHVWEEVHHGW